MRWLGIKCVLSFCCFFFNINPISAQKAPTIAERVDPPFWYQELGSDTLQLLFYGNEIQQAELSSKDVQIKLFDL
jgi:hypothetical protein